MGRPKLVDYYKSGNQNEELSPQEEFMRYLENRVKMVYNYAMSRWGVKPHGYLDAIQLASVQTNWGEHYILNIVFPHSLTNYYTALKGFIRFIISAFPIPQMVSLTITPSRQGDEEVDLITVEARLVMVAIVG